MSQKKEKPTTVEIKEEVVNDGVDYENNTEFTVFTENNTVSKESLVAESESNELAPRCSLQYSDLKEISDNRMLNDNIIKMLKKQFSQANGLQDPVLGQTLNFNVNRNLPFVQVLHDGSPAGTQRLYDVSFRAYLRCVIYERLHNVVTTFVNERCFTYV